MASTAKELNDALWKKMYVEQQDFEHDLLQQSKENIMIQGRAYSVREDILYWLNYNPLSEDEAAALLELPNPLGVIYDAWLGLDSSAYMEEIGECTQSVAWGLNVDRKRKGVRDAN